jgi:hypothetical protein
MSLTIESNRPNDQSLNSRYGVNLGNHPWSPKAPRNGKINTALLNNQINQTLCRQCSETPGKKIWTLGYVGGGLLRVGDQEWTAGLAHDLLTSMVKAWKEMPSLFSREQLHIFVLQMIWGSIRYENGEEWRLATHVEPLISEEISFLVRRSHALVRNPNVLLRPINLNIFKTHRNIPSHAKLIFKENWESMLTSALCSPIPVIVHLNPRKSELPPLWSIPLRLWLNLPLPAHDAILGSPLSQIMYETSMRLPSLLLVAHKQCKRRCRCCLSSRTFAFSYLIWLGRLYEWLGNISRVDDLLSSKQARKVNDILDVLSLNQE